MSALASTAGTGGRGVGDGLKPEPDRSDDLIDPDGPHDGPRRTELVERGMIARSAHEQHAPEGDGAEQAGRKPKIEGVIALADHHVGSIGEDGLFITDLVVDQLHVPFPRNGIGQDVSQPGSHAHERDSDGLHHGLGDDRRARAALERLLGPELDRHLDRGAE